MEIPVGKKCMIVGCEKMVKANDLCAMHYARSKRHDGFTGETRPKRGICSVDGCGKPHAAKGLCSLHYYRFQRTGSLDEAPSTQKTCEVEGCDAPHVANGLCQKHYMRMKRHGDVIETRASDWGAREKHPLYTTWNTLIRGHGTELCDRWKDLWLFVEDMNGTRPSKRHRLERLDKDVPFQKDNVYWREPHADKGKDILARNSEYARKWYSNNKSRVLDYEYRRHYGITLEDYERMFDEQNGVCAICGNEETRVDHRSGKNSRLAVDHCHKSNKVRALLCAHCNNALGSFDDDLDVIARAVVYLATHSGDSAPIIARMISQLQAALPISGTA